MSIKLPKNFQPVGVSNRLSILSFCATLSIDPLVGIDLATPNNFYPLKTDELLAANTASESEGVTKNRLPKIMLRSASPSHAHPNTGIIPGIQFF